MRTKQKILLVISDNKPRSCNEISELVGISSKKLGVHLFQLWEKGLIYRLDGLVNRRPHYYALEKFFESDVPKPINLAGKNEITCRVCNTSKPRSTEFFHHRSSNPEHKGTSKEFKSICKVCASKAARKNRPASDRTVKQKVVKLEVENVAVPPIVRQKIGDTTLVVFTDNWRHNKEGISKLPFSNGYESALTKVF